ncbi:amidase domain-containing protein [Agromyces sp. NPDC058110]|uniref:amidase domain-containing protein n=1 Tax=Agromyces sp. NPDC058110 TaxID=3346345 RepID=UPI0036DC8B50
MAPEPKDAPSSKLRARRRGRSAAASTDVETVIATDAEPTVAEPTEASLTVTEPAVAEPTVAESIVAESTVAEPTVADSTIAEPAVADSTTTVVVTDADTAASVVDTAESTVVESNLAPAKPSSTASGRPRHRAERVRNRRGAKAPAKGASFKRTAALGSAAAFMGLSAFGALVPAEAESSTAATDTAVHDVINADATATASAGGAAGDSITVAEPDLSPKITSGLSTASAPFTGGAEVTLTGHSLDEAASVTVGSTPATIVAAEDTKLTFQVPAVAEADKGATMPITVADAEGTPIEAVATDAPISQTASLLTQLAPAALQAEAAVDTPIDLAFTYTNDPGIDAQLNYVLTYWNTYNSAQYPVLSGVDCANFASQSLAARGFAMDGGWYYDGSTGAMSPSWASSTALRDYLLTQTSRATYLDDTQRALVKVGDIAQFDWDSSGDRDHTAVVTRVEHTDAGTKIWVGGHTKDADYWDVDEALASGGGYVTYFSIH